MALVICPVRCFSCGSEVCWKHEQYRKILQDEPDGSEKALHQVGAWRMCCRRMILGQPLHFALMKGALAPAQSNDKASYLQGHTENSDVQARAPNMKCHLMFPESVQKTKYGEDEEDDEEDSDVDMEP